MTVTTQQVADWLQRRTGLSCHQQAAVAQGASVVLAATAFLEQVLSGTASAPKAINVVAWAGVACALAAARRLATAGRRGDAVAIGAAATLTMVVLVNFRLVVDTAAWVALSLAGQRAGLSTEAWFAYLVISWRTIAAERAKHRKAMGDFAAGRITAGPAPGARVPAPALALCAAAVVMVARWPSAAPILTTACWAAYLASDLLGRCRPRPPSTRRQGSRTPWGVAQGT